MFDWIFKRLIPDCQRTGDQRVRARYGTLGACTGIGMNLLLSLVKFIVGVTTGSLAVTADAANNLSDAGGSVMALLSVRLAQKPRDEEHPFGHGRFEYIGAMGVGALILVMGAGLLKSGVESVLSPSLPAFSWLSISLLALSCGCKAWMWAFYRAVGTRVDNEAMLAAAKDSLSDVLATGGVIVSMLLAMTLSWTVDGYMGILVALLVLRAGYSVLSDTVSRLLGGKPDRELGVRIINKLLSYEGISGVHDFVLHDYGPGRSMASVHAEVPADCDFVQMHEVVDTAEREIASEMHIPICIHMDPVVLDDPEHEHVRVTLAEFLANYTPPLKMHDFRVVPGDQHINLVFDVAVPPEFRPVDALKRDIGAYAAGLDARYRCVIQIDRDYFT